MEEDFDSLQKALDSGDLSAAKTAFSTIQTAFKNGPGKSPDGEADGTSSQGASAVSGTSQKGPDLSALQKALDSGDVSAAKTALADLKKNAPKGPPPRKGSGDDVEGASETDSSSSIEAFLKALESSNGSSSASSTVSATSTDASGNIGTLLDLFAS